MRRKSPIIKAHKTSLYILFQCALGGILSPLLSNVVLNDLDWWVSNQWETFETDYKYSKGWRNIALKRTNLKPMYIVRYADDFKIFTNNHQNAQKIYHAIKNYLWENLQLEISPEKSMITNLRKRSSDFLGFKIRAVKKRKKYVARLNVMDKKKRKIIDNGKEIIKLIQKDPSHKNARNLNSWILGIHNYFKIASHVNADFSEIAYLLNRTMYNRFKSIGKYGIPINKNKTYQKFYGKNNYKTWCIAGIHIYPLEDIQTKNPMNFSQEVCNYTQVGRDKIFKNLEKGIEHQIQQLMKSYIPNRSIEYLDNRISRYSMQQGKCAITGQFLLHHEVHCHHIIPIKDGGQDTFDNLIVIHQNIHKLVHATNDTTISKYTIGLSPKSIDKINKMRVSLKLNAVDVNKKQERRHSPLLNKSLA